jgi:S1-C subfamily serine protease
MTGPHEITPPPPTFPDVPKINISLGSVRLGYTPQDQASGEFVRQALRAALTQSGVFDQTSDLELNVTLRHLSVRTDYFGFAMNSNATGSYAIKTVYGKTIFERTVQSKGEATPQDTLLGAERNELATRRAISSNFARFRDELIAFVRENGSTLVALATEPEPEPIAAFSDKQEEGSDGSKSSTKYENYLQAVAVVRSSSGLGSGFFVNNRGLLLTNRHVVGSDDTVSVTLKSGKTVSGEVIAMDKRRDLALVSVQDRNVSWLQLGSIEETPIGGDVIAIGTPEGLTWSITKGIVSAVRDNDGIQLVQTDAAINKGNSGGPLISLQTGKVLGINSFILRDTEGLNFAVSAEEALKAFPAYLKAHK